MAEHDTRNREERQRRFNALVESLARTEASEMSHSVRELKDVFERSVFTNEYGPYLQQALATFLDVLRRIRPQFVKNSPEQVVRNTLLEIIAKCQSPDAFKQHSNSLFSLAFDVMRNDNDENAVIAIKLAIDLLRAVKRTNEPQGIQDFIGFCRDRFRNFKESFDHIRDAFDRNVMPRSIYSLRVLYECGNGITALYPIYQPSVPIKDFLVFAFEIVAQTIPDILKSPQPLYFDFVHCQTKMLNFVAQFVQSQRHDAEFRHHGERVAQAVFNMIRTVPHELFTIRKDLFLGFSHIIKSDHKRFFFKYLNDLLDEEALLGTNPHVSLRSTWFSAMLVYFEVVRDEMNIMQFSRAIGMICRNMHLMADTQLQSLNVLRLFCERIKLSRESQSPITKQVYNLLLLTVSKRLSFCKFSVEEFISKFQEDHSYKPVKPAVGFQETIYLYKRTMELLTPLIWDLFSLPPSAAMLANTHSQTDEFMTRTLVKIIRNVIVCVKIYSKINLKNEESRVINSLSQIIGHLNNGFPTILQDILRQLLPFLFLSSMKNNSIFRIIKTVQDSSHDNLQTTGEVILNFVIENLEIFGHDVYAAKAKMLQIHRDAKEPFTDDGHIAESVRSTLALWLESVINIENLRINGLRLVERLEELSGARPAENYVKIAKRVLSACCNDSELRRHLATKWMVQHEELVSPKPPVREVIKALSDSDAKRMPFACRMREFTDVSEDEIDALLSVLFRLTHKRNMHTYEDVVTMLGRLHGQMYHLPSSNEINCKSDPPYSLTLSITYDSSSPPIVLPLDKTLSKLSKIFIKFKVVDFGKAVKPCCSLLQVCLLRLQEIAPVDFASLLRTAEAVRLQLPVERRNHGCNNALTQTFINAYKLLIFALAHSDEKSSFATFASASIKYLSFLVFLQTDGESFYYIDAVKVLHNLSSILNVQTPLISKGLKSFYSQMICTIEVLLENNPEALSRTKSLMTLVESLITACWHQDFKVQVAACDVLISLLPKLPDELVLQADLLKCALNVLEMVPVLSSHEQTEVPCTLASLLIPKYPEAEVVQRLATGLLGKSFILRMHCAATLERLAGSIPMADFLDQYREPLPKYLSKEPSTVRKQLHDIILNFQVSNYVSSTRTQVLDACSFCLKHGVILPVESNVVSAILLSFLEGVVKLIPLDDAPDFDEMQKLTSEEKISMFTVMRTFLEIPIVNEMVTQGHEQLVALRNDIVFRFLRFMSDPDLRVVETVRSGIKLVRQRDESKVLPQEELKRCLRPTLLELAKSTQAPTLKQLKNFSRLLELIANCFNKTLGIRLLKHLSDSCRKDTSNMQLISAIVNLFHLMPDCVDSLMVEIVKNCIDGEQALKRAGQQGYLFSHFREPMIRYLNRFAQGAVNYLLSDNAPPWLLVTLIDHPLSFGLRDELSKRYREVITERLLVSEELKSEGLQLINALSKYSPRWLSTKDDLMKHLLEIWRLLYDQRGIGEDQLIKAGAERVFLLKCFIRYVRYKHRGDIAISVFFNLPLGFGLSVVSNTIFLRNFLAKELPKLLGFRDKKNLVRSILDALKANTLTREHKAALLEHLMHPLLTDSFERNQVVFTRKMQKTVVDIIKTFNSEVQSLLCVEMMRLGSLLIEKMKDEFWKYRKEIIRFCWSMIKSDNPIVKGNAYVNVARFISVYTLPDSLIFQLLGVLLKSHNQELNPFALTAFDCMRQSIERLFLDSRLTVLLNELIRRALMHETKQAQTLVHLIDIILKNEGIFYHLRRDMTPHFLHWIKNLNIEMKPNYNAKKLLLDLTSAIITWSQRHAQESTESFLELSQREMLVNFFARFGQAPALYMSSNPQRNFEQMNQLSAKCLQSLQAALQLWPDVTFKCKNWTEALKKSVQLIQHQRDNNLDSLKKLLERSINILRILAKYGRKDALTSYPEAIVYLVQMIKSVEAPHLVGLFCEIVGLLLVGGASELTSQLQKIVEQLLAETIKQPYLLAVKLMAVLISAEPYYVNINMPGLMQITRSLTTELVRESKKDDRAEALMTAFDILTNNLTRVKEKKILQNILMDVFEKINDPRILEKAAKLMDAWLDSEDDLELQNKDQCTILLKLFNSAKTDTRKVSLHLELVHRVLSSSAPQSDDRTKLMKAFHYVMIKELTHPLRREFDRIVKDMLGATPWHRLLFAIEQNDSERSTWVKSAVDLILSSLEDGRSIVEVKDQGFEGLMETESVVMLMSYQTTLKEHCISAARDWVMPLRQMMYHTLAKTFYIDLFVQIWASCTKAQQETLVYRIESFVLKGFSLEPYTYNPIETTLVALASCQPLPILKPEVLQYVAKTQNCWHIALALLETSEEWLRDQIQPSRLIERLYHRLGEVDHSHGWKYHKAELPETKAGVDLLLAQDWKGARDHFFNLLSLSAPSRDVCVWDEGWEECTKRLGDWESLKAYGESGHDVSYIEACWMLDDFPAYKERVTELQLTSHPQVQYQLCIIKLTEGEDFDAALKQIEPKLSEANRNLMIEWHCLPENPSSGHLPVMLQFHLHNELAEACSAIRPLKEMLSRDKRPDINKLLTTHRLREPKSLEPFEWGSVLKARKAFYKAITDTIRQSNTASRQDLEYLFQDNAWADIVHARLARKAGMQEEALRVLEGLVVPDNEYYRAENFLMTKEKVKLALACKQPDAALQLTRAYVKIDNSVDEYHAEMFRLKAKAYDQKNDLQKAKNCLGNAIYRCAAYRRSYLNWAKLSDSMYAANSDISLAKEALVGYMIGLSDNIPKYSGYVVRILSLLTETKDDDLFAKYIDFVPNALWVPWLYQLVKSLANPDNSSFKLILSKLLKTHSQEVAYYIAAFFKEEEIQECPMQTALQALKEEFVSGQPLVACRLEYFIELLTTSFKMSPVEDLFNTIEKLINALKPLDETNETNMREVLRIVASKFFDVESDLSTLYKASFEADFSQEQLDGMRTGEIYSKLREWRARLQPEVSRLHSARYLQSECSELLTFCCSDLHVPGLPNCVMIDRFLPEVRSMRSRNSNRVISVLSEEGRVYEFMVGFYAPQSYESTKLSQILGVLNSSLARAHDYTKLKYDVLAVIPLSPKYKLVQVKPFLVSLQELYEASMADQAIDSEALMKQHMVRLTQEVCQLSLVEPQEWEDDAAVPEFSLSLYLQRCHQSPEKFFIFKKQLTTSTALLYVLTQLLNIPVFAIGADYLDDPPTRSSSPESPYKFGQGDLPPIESRIFQYLFYTTKQKEQSTTLSLKTELELTGVAACLQGEVDALMGRKRVLLMKSINLMIVADDVSSQVQFLCKSMTHSSLS